MNDFQKSASKLGKAKKDNELAKRNTKKRESVHMSVVKKQQDKIGILVEKQALLADLDMTLRRFSPKSLAAAKDSNDKSPLSKKIRGMQSKMKTLKSEIKSAARAAENVGKKAGRTSIIFAKALEDEAKSARELMESLRQHEVEYAKARRRVSSTSSETRREIREGPTWGRE